MQNDGRAFSSTPKTTNSLTLFGNAAIFFPENMLCEYLTKMIKIEYYFLVVRKFGIPT